MTRESLEALLILQGHDTRLDQVRHQLANLPARTARDDAVSALRSIESDAERVGEDRADLGRQQRRIEDEVASLEAKRTAHNDRLYGGTVTNARELQDLQEEVESLGRRISQLDDDTLELMEQIEPVDAALAELNRSRAAQNDVVQSAETALLAAEAELAVQLDAATADRTAAADGIEPDLLRQYDSLRAGGGGVAIARLDGNQCGGCHLTLSAVEAASLRKNPDEVAHCEECGRILVP